MNILSEKHNKYLGACSEEQKKYARDIYNTIWEKEIKKLHKMFPILGSGNSIERYNFTKNNQEMLQDWEEKVWILCYKIALKTKI